MAPVRAICSLVPRGTSLLVPMVVAVATPRPSPVGSGSERSAPHVKLPVHDRDTSQMGFTGGVEEHIVLSLSEVVPRTGAAHPS